MEWKLIRALNSVQNTVIRYLVRTKERLGGTSRERPYVVNLDLFVGADLETVTNRLQSHPVLNGVKRIFSFIL